MRQQQVYNRFVALGANWMYLYFILLFHAVFAGSRFDHLTTSSTSNVALADAVYYYKFVRRFIF